MVVGLISNLPFPSVVELFLIFVALVPLLKQSIDCPTTGRKITETTLKGRSSGKSPSPVPFYEARKLRDRASCCLEDDQGSCFGSA